MLITRPMKHLRYPLFLLLLLSLVGPYGFSFEEEPLLPSCSGLSSLARADFSHVTSENLFSRNERLAVLKAAHIDENTLQAILNDPEIETEKAMVDTALRYFHQNLVGLDAPTKACLWEEMAWLINERLSQPTNRVSWGYRWQHEGSEYFVYQGPLALYQGRHATIIIAPDATVYEGLAEPISDIQAWDVDLDSLRKI
jgi:hypothetical protein